MRSPKRSLLFASATLISLTLVSPASAGSVKTPPGSDPVRAITADNVGDAIVRAGWKVFGKPDRPNAESITLSVIKGQTGCAVSVQLFDADGKAKAFEKAMRSKGGEVRRSGMKAVTAVCPGDPAGSKALMKAVLNQYGASVKGVRKSNLEAKLRDLGWKKVGKSQAFNPHSITLPIAKGNVGGAASFAYFEEKLAVDAFVDTIAQQDGAAWLNTGGLGTLVIVLPGNAPLARETLASLTGAPATPGPGPRRADKSLEGVPAFRIHQLSPNALRSRLEGAGWNILGQPREEGSSVTISINRGVISGAASLKIFDTEPAADAFEQQIRTKPDSAVVRSGNKILAVVLPDNRGEAVRLVKALLAP